MDKINKDYFDLVQMLGLKNNMNEIKEHLGDEPDKKRNPKRPRDQDAINFHPTSNPGNHGK